MKEELKQWHSPNLNIEMKTLVFGHGGYPILLFPTSMGSYFENKDFKLIDAVQQFVDSGKVKIYCPGSRHNTGSKNAKFNRKNRKGNSLSKADHNRLKNLI